MAEAENVQSILEEYAYLWESGEWTLHVTNVSRAKITFIFSTGKPTLQELVAIRPLLSKFANAPISELKTALENVAEFFAGEFDGIGARRMEAEAKARGLQVRRDDTSFLAKSPVSKDGKIFALIDNDVISRLVTAEMERRGVPIVHGEAD